MKCASMIKQIPMQGVPAPGKRFSLPVNKKKSAAYHKGFAARCQELMQYADSSR